MYDSNASKLWRLRGNIVLVRYPCFRSIVRGKLREESDIDLLVEFDADYKLHGHIRLTQGWRRWLGWRVDVMDHHALREELRASILKEAQSV